MLYSMKDLSSRVKKTQQALYQLINKNKDLESIVKEHSEKKGKLRFYDEAVLEWLINYYGITKPTADEVGEGIVEPEAQEIPQQTAPEAPSSVSAEMELDFLKRENDLLRGQIEVLTKDKAEQRTEIDRLLLLLQEEKQEKKALLIAAAPPVAAAPKHTFLEKIKHFFGK